MPGPSRAMWLPDWFTDDLRARHPDAVHAAEDMVAAMPAEVRQTAEGMADGRLIVVPRAAQMAPGAHERLLGRRDGPSAAKVQLRRSPRARSGCLRCR
ncbi:hypothetical protein NOCA2300004 [metagenome]|uniref:Uncharacterized protein n=1 Tax=metagenome TaxID=256318 RepID=A0A2P2C4W9_9ZZZZ